MILHMGGVFGDKKATLDRFRENYKNLSQDIKNRLVLENDDVSWSVHDLLPICEELNIPLVLDFHHHNIVFDADKVREGTLDIMQLFDRIKATWTRKGITQKMHYSEPLPDAITPRQRRKHSPRVSRLPPCDPTMDLMIEAKDKEQAVFELMKIFKLPGHERINEMIPHVREDENPVWKPPKRNKKSGDFMDLSKLSPPPPLIPEEEVSMGGPHGRVYWPPGKEDWLRPPKRTASRKAKTSPQTTSIDLETTDHVKQDVQSEENSAEKPRTSARKRKMPATDDLSVDGTKSLSDLTETSSPGPPAPRRSQRARRVTSYTDQL